MFIGIAALAVAIYAVFIQPAPTPQIACQEWVIRSVEMGGETVQKSSCVTPTSAKKEG